METATLHLANTKPANAQIIAAGIAQILLWGGSYFLLSVLSTRIIQETSWSYQSVFGCLSFSLLIAGLLLPSIGKQIQSTVHNSILHYAGVVMAAGLIIIGLSHHFLLFVLGWGLIGIAMAMGLYDALFASLGKRFGINAKKAIVMVTLISSLAPSISWLLSDFLLKHIGWRNTCFCYAAILLLTIYPIHKFVFNSAEKIYPPASENIDTPIANTNFVRTKMYFLVLLSFTIGSVITTGTVIYLIDILISRKLEMTQVLTAIAFLGPSQAAARALELMIPGRTVIEMSFISTFAIVSGIILFMLNPALAIPGVILFGIGNGLRSVLRGTLPLSVFGTDHYAYLMGQLARMPLIAQAVTPLAGGLIIQQLGIDIYMGILCAICLINIFLIVMLRQQTIKKQIQ